MSRKRPLDCVYQMDYHWISDITLTRQERKPKRKFYAAVEYSNYIKKCEEFAEEIMRLQEEMKSLKIVKIFL